MSAMDKVHNPSFGIRFERLLALIKRNLDKLDELDREVFYEAFDWYYHKGNKGKWSRK